MSWLSEAPAWVVVLATGLGSVGPGLAGYASWIVTAVILVGLALVAWWSRPARRATRAELRRARQRGDEESPT